MYFEGNLVDFSKIVDFWSDVFLGESSPKLTVFGAMDFERNLVQNCRFSE